MHGKKAENLAVLQEIGLFHVPEFYTIDSGTLAEIDKPMVRKKIIATLDEWRAATGCHLVAVRSSAEGEDSMQQSFAGQFASVMKVDTDQQFIDALETVANSRPSKAYSGRDKIKVHAIVQRYIEPDSAGVLFTVNPSNGASEMLVNVAAGHGSKVVDGEAAQSIHINRITGDIRSVEKRLILSDPQIHELQKVGQAVERYFCHPQDVEWAFAGGKLYVVQTRPITKIAHLQVWDRANIGESFPGIVTPLTFSISRRGYELVYKSQGYAAGLDWYELEANRRTFGGMVGLFAGRMYYNLANWYRFIGLFPNNTQNQKYLDEQLQTIGDAAYLPPSKYPLSYRVGFFMRVVRRAALFELEKKRYWRYLENAYKTYENLPFSNDTFMLLDRYAFIEQSVIPHMGRSADNDFFVMIYHGILKSRMKHWLGADSAHVTDFLGALYDVISARQATLLMEIAAHVKSDETAVKLLQSGSYGELDDALLSGNAAPLILEYREKFLHRFAEDQKIEVRNPLLSLDGFYGLIKTYTKLDEKAVGDRAKRALVAEEQRHQKVVQKLKFGQRLLYMLLLSRLKHHLKTREHNRLLRGKAYAYLRELFPAVGATLKASGGLDHEDDVFYLDIEELYRLVDGTGYGTDFKQIVRTRKRDYEKYVALNAPERFITTGQTDTLPEEFYESTQGQADVRDSLSGTISSPGTVEGVVVVLDKPIVPDEPFDILVVSHTDPGWTPLIALAKGVIVEHGGILSHAAIVTRELGIPSIIGVENATRALKDGMKVRIHTPSSSVEIVE